MEFRFAQIEWLLLLIPVLALVWWSGKHLRTLGRQRRVWVLIFRTLLFTCLILALARLEIVRKTNELAVMFLVDDSYSIPPELREYSRQFINQSLKRMSDKDRVGILLFGSEASIERNPNRDSTEIASFASAPRRDQTNIAEAMRLAMAAFPADAKKRIVLLSDGNQTAGDAEEAARRAAGSKIALDIAPLTYEYQEDIVVENVTVENQVSIDEPFDLKVIVSSPEDTEAKLNVLRDGQVLASETISLESDRKNVFVLPTQVTDTGFHKFQVQVEAADDSNPENNLAHGYTMARGEPKVLFVEGSDPDMNRLANMLRAEDIEVDVILPGTFPQDPLTMQAYNAVIFANVHASELNKGQQLLLERAVHDMGMGFIMIGGEDSFGAGGWQDTPVEDALPVFMEIKHKKVLPKGALALILHTAEIPKQEYWARQIAIAALNVLQSRDEFGALAYDWRAGDSWIVPLEEARDKPAIRRTILSGSYGDMPQFSPTMEMALSALNNSNASVKHMIIISDGDAQPPSQNLMSRIAVANITVSTVHVAGHGMGSGTSVMQEIARLGKGNYYNVTNNATLPQIFVKEASIVRKSLIYEEPFIPVNRSSSDILAGIGAGEYPQLQGYVGTSPKDLADVPLVTEESDPLLAHWQYGLGKTVAFTSDAYMKWARVWFDWGKMAKFWAQAVRWSLRAQSSQNLQISTEIEDGVGRAIIDAIDEEGRFINFLDFDAQALNPSFDSQPLEFRQTGPGRYEAEFPAAEVGTYLVTASASGEDGFQDLISGGASLSYSPEFRSSTSNEALLRKLADIGNGRLLDEESFVFDHNLPSGSAPKPMFPLLLTLALILLPIDIFLRRVLIDWAMVRAGLAYSYAWTRSRFARRAVTRDERMEALFEAKSGHDRKTEERPRPSPRDYRRELQERLQNAEVDEDLAPTTDKPKSKESPSESGREESKEEKTSEKKGSESYTSKLLEAKRRARR